MKSTSKLLIFVFALLALAANAYAESPRKEQAKANVRKPAEDNVDSLREKYSGRVSQFLIVPGKSIGPVSLGMSAADVLKIMGPPENTGITGVGVFRSGSIGIAFNDALKVTHLYALKGSSYATADGIKCGSSKLEVDAKLGVSVKKSNPMNPGPMGQCYRMNGGAMWVWLSRSNQTVEQFTVVPDCNYQ